MRKESTSDFGVNFPDFPGCVTAGSSLEDARKLAREALEFHIAGMIEDGESVPAPSTFDQIAADPDNRDALPFLVDVATPDEPSERVNLTFRRSVLNAIDRAAAACGESRSEYLAKAGMDRARLKSVPSALVSGAWHGNSAKAATPATGAKGKRKRA
jgi:predicted RNase H-like HicB family nuclease